MSLNKEDIKVGDWFWIMNELYPRIIEEVEFLSDLDNSITREEDSIIINGEFTFLFKSRGFGNGIEFSKWTPQPNETCVFWNNKESERAIRVFKKEIIEKNKVRYLGVNTKNNSVEVPRVYDNIAPVTFDLSVYWLGV